jgi:hypothetical protein
MQASLVFVATAGVSAGSALATATFDLLVIAPPYEPASNLEGADPGGGGQARGNGTDTLFMMFFFIFDMLTCITCIFSDLLT